MSTLVTLVFTEQLSIDSAGYASSRITVLTMYNGQRLLLTRQLPRDQYPDLRVSVVDNYQGEENDIIVLSLVRSNDAGNLGFVKTQNRILVSLSRARIGLYVFGNVHKLTRHCEHWKAVIAQVNDMERETRTQLIGPSIPLYCQNHPDYKTLLSSPEDLQNCPDGLLVQNFFICFLFKCIILSLRDLQNIAECTRKPKFTLNRVFVNFTVLLLVLIYRWLPPAM